MLDMPYIYNRQALYMSMLTKGAGETGHFFGGDFNLTTGGATFGPAPLHRVITLDLGDLMFAGIMPFRTLPLVFPYRFDGGTMLYRVAAESEIDIQSIKPSESNNRWPYDNYPNTFPRHGLVWQKLKDMSLEEFEGEHLLQDLPTKEDPDQMIVVVPENKGYGVDLWNKDHDVGVLSCFVVDRQMKTVECFNQCD